MYRTRHSDKSFTRICGIAQCAVAALLLAACSDDIAPTALANSAGVSLNVSGNSPYSMAGSLPAAAYQSIKFGVNGHPVNDSIAVYATDAPIDEQLRVVKGLGGTVYRIDVVSHASETGISRVIESINNAYARGMQVVLVITDFPAASFPSGVTGAIGDSVARKVISRVLLAANPSVVAVELGNELDVQLVDENEVGQYSSDYDMEHVRAMRNFYQGMRSVFVNHGNSYISGMTRLLNSSTGHTYWIDAARKNRVCSYVWNSRTRKWVLQCNDNATVVFIAPGTKDQISWHWYHNLQTAAFSFLSSPYWWPDSRVPVISQLRGFFPAGFEVWVTEFNRTNGKPGDYNVIVSGDCPNDEHTLISAPLMEPLMNDFVAQPEVKAIIAYEAYDQRNTPGRLEERYGLVSRGCPNVSSNIFFKPAGETFTSTVLRLRDERTALGHTALALLTEGYATTASDSTLAAQSVVNIGARATAAYQVDNSAAKARWLSNAYLRILHRDGDAFWLYYLGQTGYDRHRVESEIYASDEYWYNNGATNATYVAALYRDIQQRDGGSEGIDYWVWRIENGDSRREVARLFLSSPEHLTRFVNRIHQVAFGRDAAAHEVDFWLPQVYASITYEQMVEHLLGTVELSDKSRQRRKMYLREGF